MNIIKKVEFIVSKYLTKKTRLDKILLYFFPEYSRSYLQKLIFSSNVFVNFKIAIKPKKNIFFGDKIFVFLSILKINLPEPIIFDIIYEDKYLLIINKPAGLVVHPAPGNNNGTLLNGLLYLSPNFYHLPRAGIIHRLDKNTTGLMIIAKCNSIYYKFLNLLKNRKITREYQAFVFGNLITGGTINAPIKRHDKKKISMMVHDSGKNSITHYKIIKKFNFYTHLRIRLETGRTHQIRVHMLHINHPILGDSLYKNRNSIPKGINKNDFYEINRFSRQALHADKIKFFHPITNSLIKCCIPLPLDMLNLIKFL